MKLWLRLSKRSREVGIHYYESASSNDGEPNLGDASGAFIGGWVITHMGLTYLPWAGALLLILGLILGLVSYRQDLREKRTSV